MNDVKKLGSNQLATLRAKWANELGLSRNPTAEQGAPVSFTAHLDTIAPGQTQVLGTSGLANGYRTPYLIDEIRMQAYATVPSAIPLQPSYAIQFQFRTGAYAFSAVPIPMMLYAPWYLNAGTTAGTYALQAQFLNVGILAGDEARWLLPRPLWMAPGDQIQSNVSRLLGPASAGNGNFAVDVTYVGRSLPPGTAGPKVRYVPWVAHYVHDFANVYSETTTEFRNPFTIPLQIQRLIGRPMSKSDTLPFDTHRIHMQQSLLGVAATKPYVSAYIEDSLGYKITNQYTPAANIFDSERCSWTFQRPIGPRDQLNMKFQTKDGGDNTKKILFGVAMHGHREETA